MKIKTFLLIFALCFCFLPAVKAETCSENCVAKIGETQYASINEAVNSVTGSDAVTIEILKDSTDESGVFLVKGEKNIIIDFNNHKVVFAKDPVGSTGTENQAMHFEKGNVVVLKNGTIVIANVPDKIKMGIQNYSNLTLENITFDASKTTIKYAISNNAGVVNFKGNTNIYASSLENAKAFDVYWWSKNYPEGPKVTIDTTGEIRGNIELDGDGVNVVEGKNNSLTIKNVKHTGIIDVINDQATVLVTGGSYSDENVKDYIGKLNRITKKGDFYVVGDNNGIEVKLELGTAGFESEKALDNSYKLVVAPTTKENAEKANKTVTEKLADKKTIKDINVINVYDIEIQDAHGETVEMKDGKFVISLPVKEEMQKFDLYKVAYIKDNKVEEVFEAKLVDGKIVFNTTHLSTYAVIGMNKVIEENPKTGDNIFSYLIIGSLSLISLTGGCLYLNRKKNN